MATKTETKATATPKVKKFKNTDLIPCKSVTNGELIMVGDKTGVLYQWADYGDVEGVQYQDLLYSARSARNGYVKYPRFIILDEDFVDQNPDIKKIYDSMYSTSDLKDIFNLPVSQMKKTIADLPDGAKESLKGLAATMIDNGTLDSLRKIKALDEIFGTQLLLVLSEE